MKPVDRPKSDPGDRCLHPMTLALAGLAILCCLGLDFLAARRGEPAFLFSSRTPARPPTVAADRSLDENRAAGPEVRGDREKEAQPQPQPAAPETPSASPSPPARPAPRARERLAAIIIDDMGNSLESLQEVLDLGVPLTISVLPQSPYAVETAQAAHDHGLEVMLHLPGESLNHQEDEMPVAPVIRTDMGPEEIRALVVDSLGRVPFVTGVNNHMGSKLTEDRAAMAPLLDVVKNRGLFFIDSLTGSRSIAYDLARRMGLRAAYRNVFLDSEVGVDYSRGKLIELLEQAKKKGKAIAIGHPFPETLRALRDNLSLPGRYGVRLVPASQVIPD